MAKQTPSARDENPAGVETPNPPRPPAGKDNPPAPEDLRNNPHAPASLDATAVVTTATGQKYGWQNAPIRTVPEPQACIHIGIVTARAQLAVHDLGHEWICECGQVFVVALNRGDKKVLMEKEKLETDG